MRGARIVVHMGTTYVITLHSERDSLGRQHMTVEWSDPDGIWRKELGTDGSPVGYRRGQCYFTTLTSLTDRLRERGVEFSVQAA